MSLPSRRMVPALGKMKPAIIMRVVVLPDPLGPRRLTNSPLATSSETRSTALTAP